jgi:3-oxoacyl-(acyl-carrier-protein) synthase
VLESLESARERGARVHAEIVRRASASDPSCPATGWSVDGERMTGVLRRVASGPARRTVRTVYLHASGSPPAEAAESGAASSVFPEARAARGAHVFGSMAAAGGFDVAFAAHEAATLRADEATVAAAWAWGGALYSIMLSGPPS